MKSRVGVTKLFAQPAGVWERAKESSRAVDMRAQDDDKQRSERRAHNLMNSEPVKARSDCKSHKERSSVSERTTMIA